MRRAFPHSRGVSILGMQYATPSHTQSAIMDNYSIQCISSCIRTIPTSLFFFLAGNGIDSLTMMALALTSLGHNNGWEGSGYLGKLDCAVEKWSWALDRLTNYKV